MQTQIGGKQTVNLHPEGGEKEYKQQSLQSVILWCGNSFCV